MKDILNVIFVAGYSKCYGFCGFKNKHYSDKTIGIYQYVKALKEVRDGRKEKQ